MSHHAPSPAAALAFGSALMAFGALPAEAAPQELGFSLATPSAMTETLHFDKFDSGLGTLTGVTFELTGSTTAIHSTINISGGEGTGTATTSLIFRVGDVGSPIFESPGSQSSSCGTGSGTCSNTDNGAATTPSFGPPVTINSGLAGYQGSGQFDIAVSLADFLTSPDCSAMKAAPNSCTADGSASWDGRLQVSFAYTPSTQPPVTDIPEPGAFAVLASGLAAFGMVARRRKT